jgi:hypothetical protein
MKYDTSKMTSNNINSIELPKYVGGYRLGDGTYSIVFNLTKKPCWLHRKCVELIIGWKWVDGQ